MLEHRIFEGREYIGRNAIVHPSPGGVIGEARLPQCNGFACSYAAAGRSSGANNSGRA